jgi:hypothetical protein
MILTEKSSIKSDSCNDRGLNISLRYRKTTPNDIRHFTKIRIYARNGRNGTTESYTQDAHIDRAHQQA